MKTDRLNAFTDGVVAIIITIMVLELPVPRGAGMAALRPELTLFGAYALSFIKVGIYWFQHHNVLQASRRVDSMVLLANLLFLFWLSLIPFLVRWVGDAGVSRDPVIAFGVLMLLCFFSFAFLLLTLRKANDSDAPLARLVKLRRKAPITIMAYLIAIASAFLWPLVAVAIYVAVAVMWLIPDKRFDRLIE